MYTWIGRISIFNEQVKMSMLPKEMYRFSAIPPNHNAAKESWNGGPQVFQAGVAALVLGTPEKVLSSPRL